MRRIADEALTKGITPLEVMLKNMRYYWLRVGTSAEQFKAAATKAGVIDADGNFDEAKVAADPTLCEILDRHCMMRSKAQLMAVEAAPYTIPKLSAIAFKGEVNHAVKAIVDDMTPEQAAAAYQETLKLAPPSSTAEAMPEILEAVAEEVADG